MAGTPITVPGNPEVTNETYRGGACTSKSYASCSTYSLKTVDNESLFIGTFYNAHAITVDSSKTITANNTNFPDTFCPLGWQLPYDGTGGDYYDKSKSWIFLFTTYNISFNTGTAIDINKIKMYPLSYIYSGYYYWGLGRLYYQGSVGYYWSQTIVGSASAYGLDTWSGAIRPSDIASRSFGFPLRCVSFGIREIAGTCTSAGNVARRAPV